MLKTVYWCNNTISIPVQNAGQFKYIIFIDLLYPIFYEYLNDLAVSDTHNYIH